MIENRKSTETVKQSQWWTAVQRSGCRQSWPSSLSDEVPSAYRACQRSQRWKGVHSQRSVRSRTGFENIGENSPCLQMSSASHALHLPSRWWSTCYQRYPEISRWNFPWTSPHELGHCGFFGAKVTRLGTSCRARQGWVAIEWASCLGGAKTEKSWRFVSQPIVQWKDVKNFKKSQMPEESASGWRWWRWCRWSSLGAGFSLTLLENCTECSARWSLVTETCRSGWESGVAASRCPAPRPASKRIFSKKKDKVNSMSSSWEDAGFIIYPIRPIRPPTHQGS